jgi:8-oxo-dGTP diphosphatase
VAIPPFEMDASGAARFRFCPKCGARLDLETIEGRQRLVCAACAFIFYQNPTAGVAVLILDGDSVLLTLRKHGFRAGLWDRPGGHVEYDEDIRESARRELLEETGFEVEVGEPYEVLSNFHSPETHVIGVWFRGSVLGGNAAGRRRCGGRTVLRAGCATGTGV